MGEPTAVRSPARRDKMRYAPRVSALGKLSKLRLIWQQEGPKGAARKVAGELKLRAYHPDRQLVLLRVDLSLPAHRVRPKDADPSFRVLPYGPSELPRLRALLERTEPARLPTLEARLAQGAQGFVAEDAGEAIGYVFFVLGSDDPTEVVHADLHWLPLRPTKGEVYTFDYWLAEAARGRGNLFARSVQQAQHEMGYSASYGYVEATNTSALWLYRTIGWKEVGRVLEHRILGKLSVIDDRVYLVRAFDRLLLGRWPLSVEAGRPSA